MPLATGNGNSPAAVARFQFASASDQNEAYLGQRMVFDREGVESFDLERVATRSIPRIVLRALATGAVVFGVLFALIAVAGAILTFVTPSFMDGLIRVVGFVVICGAALLALLATRRALKEPINVPLSEWRFVLDGHGDAADAALDRIADALRRSQTPIEETNAYRTGEQRTYLEVVRKPYLAYISCFAYGADLYIGWTLWWQTSAWELRRNRKRAGLLATLRDLLRPSVSPALALTMRADEGKALREVIHNATRRAAEATTDERSHGQGLQVLGATVPVTARPEIRL